MPSRKKLTPFEDDTATLAARLVKLRRPWQLRKARRVFETFYVQHVLDSVEGDREKAARLLGISHSSLKTKIRADYTRA